MHLVYPQKEWLEADVNDWGFLRFDVDGDVMRARFIRSSNGESNQQPVLRILGLI